MVSNHLRSKITERVTAEGGRTSSERVAEVNRICDEISAKREAEDTATTAEPKPEPEPEVVKPKRTYKRRTPKPEPADEAEDPPKTESPPE